MACSEGYCWSAGVPSVNAGIPTGGLVEKKVIEIGGAYVITISATFKNCIFRMSGDARINVLPDGNDPINVSFSGCSIYGCGTMWQGIIVNATGASDDFMFEFLDGNIEDAYIGLRLDELKGEYTIADNSFRNNHIGISNIRQNGGVLNAVIVRNHFWRSADLAERTGSLEDPFPMPNYPQAHAGIKYVNVVSSVGVLETGQTGNTANLFECLIDGILTQDARVQSISNIFQIMGRSGVHSTGGAARVVDCQFLVSGYIGIRTLSATLKAQKNIFSGVWDEGIRATQNLNGELITINENNQFTVSAPGWIYGIYVERPQALTGKHCIINGNTFTVTSSPAQFHECIHVEDNLDASDELEISWNNITVNSSKGGVNGITVFMGRSDQLNVHDNVIHYGTIREKWANFGIWLHPKTGQNNSTGNIVRNSSVTGINVEDPDALHCAFHVGGISKTEFCDNEVDFSYHGMHFTGQNSIELRGNEFANHTYGLRITGTDARIGTQFGRGNIWDLDPDACVLFATQVDGDGPLNSRFIVPQGNNLPWLPGQDKIDPDPTSTTPAWFAHGTHPEDAVCKSPLEPPPARTLTPFEQEVVLNTSTLSGVNLWDLKREVYAKLLLFPELRPSSSPEETFFNGLSSTVLASFGQVTQGVSASLGLSSGFQTVFDSVRIAIGQAFETLGILDESLDYSDLTNLTPTWFAQRDSLLQIIALNAITEDSIISLRVQQMNDSLQISLTYNASISASQPYEHAWKTINNLHIRRLLGLPMTQTLYEMALDLAQQGADTIGAAREAALWFLAPCDQAQYLYREDHPEETEEKLSAQLQAPERTMLIAPNPSTGLFEVLLPQQTGGSLMVYNTHGQRLREQSIAAEASKVSLDLGLFPNGLYWVVLVNEAGNVLGTAKVSVAH